MSGKQYGLILPNKNKRRELTTRKLNPLLDSDDELEKSDVETEALDWVEQSLKRSAGNASQQSQQKRLLREALKEDSSVFQYDEVYDSMKEKEEDNVQKKKDSVDKKPKYIFKILEQNERRKLEQERRQDRKIQKEREAEKDEFADKESFISASYIKKREELEQAELREKMEMAVEEKNDVAKHKNFGAFYANLFKQKLGEESAPLKEIRDPVKKQETFHVRRETKKTRNFRRRSSSRESSENEVLTENTSTPMEVDTVPKEPVQRKEANLKSQRHIIKTEEKLNSSIKEEPPSPTQPVIVPLDLPKLTNEDKLKKLNQCFIKQTENEKFVDACRRFYERKALR